MRSGESLNIFSPTLLQDWASLDDFEEMQQKIPISEVCKWLEKIKTKPTPKKRSKRQMKILNVTWCMKTLGRVNSKSYVAAISVCRAISCFCIFQSKNEPFLYGGHHFRWEGEQTDTRLSVCELSYLLLWLLRKLTLCAAQGRLQPKCSSSLAQVASLQLFLNPQSRALYLATVFWFPKKMRSVRWCTVPEHPCVSAFSLTSLHELSNGF